MVIRVKGYLTYRELVGERHMELGDGVTLRALLAQLEAEVGESFALPASAGRGGRRQHVPVLVNGRHCTHLPNQLDTELREGDQVDIFPPIAGGRG